VAEGWAHRASSHDAWPSPNIECAAPACPACPPA
jgi:hypothetical protein